jgi:hypothetical protein
MNNLGLWVVRRVKPILTAACLIVITEISLCAWGFWKVGDSYPIAKALETTGGFLMTLNSPDGLKVRSGLLLAARCLGWAVSFMGWLTLPLLFAITLARSQNVEQERSELYYHLLKRAERLAVNPSEASPYVAEIMAKFETSLLRKEQNARDARTGAHQTRDHEA